MNGDRIEVHVNRVLRQTYDRVTTLSLTLVGTRHNDNFVVRAIPVDVTVRGRVPDGHHPGVTTP